MEVTPAVASLLIANVILFLMTGLIGLPLDRWFGLTPSLALRGMVWQPATYMFLHANLGHILFNMLALVMFGVNLERTWGWRRFLRYYLLCGTGAGLCVVIGALLSNGLNTTTIGASGAIYGVLVAFGVMFPDATIRIYYVVPMPSKYFVILMGTLTFFSSLAGSGGGISHIAHLGGLVTGWIYLRRRGPAWRQPREGLEIYEEEIQEEPRVGGDLLARVVLWAFCGMTLVLVLVIARLMLP